MIDKDYDPVASLCYSSSLIVLSILSRQNDSMKELGMGGSQPKDRKALRRCAIKLYRTLFLPDKHGIGAVWINEAMDRAIDDYCGGTS